jgi:predicted nucleic acid-binding Zn finger protein
MNTGRIRNLVFAPARTFILPLCPAGQDCYHLESVRKAIQQSELTAIEFADSDYAHLLQAIADDNISVLGRS